MRGSARDRIGPLALERSAVPLDGVYRHVARGGQLELLPADGSDDRQRADDDRASEATINGTRVVVRPGDLAEADVRSRSRRIWDGYLHGMREAGANYVFATFGVLSYETPRSLGREGEPEMRRAPVLLMPLAIERVAQGGAWRLLYRAEGEAEINPGLRILLRQQFNLDVPDLAEGVQNEVAGFQLATYFRALERQLGLSERGWSLEPELTVSVITATGRMAIYRDLVGDAGLSDDEAWLDNPWIANEKVQKLLGGVPLPVSWTLRWR
jgi:hypothetical protein